MLASCSSKSGKKKRVEKKSSSKIKKMLKLIEPESPGAIEPWADHTNSESDEE